MQGIYDPLFSPVKLREPRHFELAVISAAASVVTPTGSYCSNPALSELGRLQRYFIDVIETFRRLTPEPHIIASVLSSFNLCDVTKAIRKCCV